MALSGRGERISARRAYELGIVSDVVATAQLRASAVRLAAAVATNSPTAMRATKRALWNSMEVGLSAARDAAAEEIWRLRNHPDHAEGVKAWREERAARWEPKEVS
jgi:enoyl-CoA hydratase/carnithine racemase